MKVVLHLAGTALLSLCLFVLPSPRAGAFEKFDEYRIMGAEIKSVTLAPPAEAEDPSRITIATVNGETIEFEADNAPDVLDECRDTVDRVIGSTQAYVQIIVLANAESMNGSLLLQCADLHQLIVP